MSLIVEDGTGISSAESYISVADADTRMAARGMTNWDTLSDAEKEEALRRSTDYMEQAYGDRWKGQRVMAEQALSWPRWGVQANGYYIGSSVVPVVVANTCADLAFKAAAGDLAEDLGRTVIREKVGPLEKEYSANSPQATRYRAADMALAPYLRGGGSNRFLIRA